jgi:hypothetical protein
MELQKLLEKTAEYVIGGWNAKAPTYEDGPELLSIPPAAREEVRDLFPRVRKGVEFEELIEGALRMTELEAFERINREVPDSQQAQLIDFCSGAGIRFTHGFARSHPNTTTIMVDQIDIQHFLTGGLFHEAFARPLRNVGKTDAEIDEMSRKMGFERYRVEVPFPGNVPDFMQCIFVANCLPNMVYAHKSINSETKLDDVVAGDKKTYCTGWNCPGDAGINALKLAVKHKAEAIVLTYTGLEFCGIRTPLSKKASRIEWNEVMEKAKADPNTEEHKYDYSKPEERRLGFALKHARILDALLWLEENGYKTRLLLLDKADRYYNGPEHIVYAFKEHDILKK